MSDRTVSVLIASAVVILQAAWASPAGAQPLTIHQIQSNTSDGDASIYDYTVVDCAGGVCVAKFPGFRPRLVLQDPDYPDAFGAIQVKDWISPFDMFNGVQIGDWVSFTDILVEEFRGTTFLQRQTGYGTEYTIVSQGNPLQPYRVVSVGEIPAPLPMNHPEFGDGWYVENHDAEPYESMRLEVRDVVVTQMYLGKAADNYNVRNSADEDCWLADYMNVDRPPDQLYHPLVVMGQQFCAVRGVFEQYTKLSDGWDYYQLITISTPDLGLCGDLNCDGVLNAFDIDPFALALSSEQGYAEAFPACNRGVADCNLDGALNAFDIDPFVELLASGG